MEDRMRVFDVTDGYAGGWMDPTRNPMLAGAVLFEPFNGGRGIKKTPDEIRAFRKRVAKRRAKKGYR